MPGDTFYITTPIYYVNGLPHVGHAYTTTAADTAARWQRLKGREVRFLTGTDEHGQKVLDAAQARGVDVKTHCDEVVVVWKAMMERMGVAYDRFIRTTDPDHERVVTDVLQRLYEQGEIYKDEYRGWYLVKDEVFVTEKEREERIASGELQPEHFRMIEETNWFFRMSRYQAPLLAYLEAHPDTIQPESRLNEVKGFLHKPLGDLCISRPKARMGWGIELPFDRDYVCYVWFDALLNYLTGAGYTVGGTAHEKWWPADWQLIGKDILTTHSVYWTSMLMALGLPLPQHLYAHGWWVSADGQKMSKSTGNVIDVNLLVDGFGRDATRFFLLREIRFGADGAFSYETFLTRYNSDLANDLGNLAHRALSMSSRWFPNGVPERSIPDPDLYALALRVLEAFDRELEGLQFKDAIDALWELVRAGNKFIDTRAPWALAKAGRTDELAQVMRDVLEVCALAGTLLLPVMPDKSATLLARLGGSEEHARAWLPGLLRGEGVLAVLRPGAPLTVGDPLFPRFAALPPAIAALFAEEEPVEAPLPEMNWIEYPDFQKVQLRVGKVLEAAPHPNGDKLLVLKIDVGEARPRTICAGIRSKFAPEDLVGNNVVVVVNLKPRVLRGVTSEGMILAAGGAEVTGLVTVNAAAGDVVR